ncbi:MAG: nucleoside triphosphate pyrophosphohydrolase [Planctomycetes bacterium]|nr:nucleoside triphosphate pyrophosphohydrolase [Planctomycetota bacterium]
MESGIEALRALLEVIDRLRGPGGCPWDREQTEASMAPHLLEETYEAVEAIRSGDAADTCEELGDVLMNVLMIARIAAESNRFDTADVARHITDKLVRRHPHVFGDVDADNAEVVLANWEKIKIAERSARPTKKQGVLSGLPVDLPSLLKAARLGEKAARVGFDWPDADGPREKVDEELAELDAALASGDRAAIESELGDVLFAITNIARRHGVDPESALRATNHRFIERFEYVEANLGERLREASLDEMERLWEEAKRAEDRR